MTSDSKKCTPDGTAPIALQKKEKGYLYCGIIAGILFVFVSICVYVLVTYGIPVYYTFHVTDELGKPIQGVEFSFEYNRNLNLSGKHSNGTKRIKLITDANGSASYFGFIKYKQCIRNLKRKGYYDKKYCKEIGETIVLRKRRKAVPMYVSNGELNNIMFPAYKGDFNFDLIKHDFLPPYGKGETADFIFSLKSRTDKDKKIKVSWDIIFRHPEDGIQIVSSNKNTPYSAPAKGYLSSYRLAGNFFIKNTILKSAELPFNEHDFKKLLERKSRSNPNRQLMYCFKIRSASGTPLYGKIYCRQPWVGQEVYSGKFYLYLQYYLNPDGTRNMECSHNLFKIK
jgi:hypothetical protein